MALKLFAAALIVALSGCHMKASGPNADGSKQAPGDFSTETGKRETIPGPPP